MLRLADEAMMRGVARRSGWRAGAARFVLAGCVAILVASAGLFFALHNRALPFETEVGEQRDFALTDGSRIKLDTDTRLGAQIGTAQRIIRLDQGEAFFAVAHDRSRPFLVRAGDVEVRATGTRFDVRHIDGQTVVTLFEGSVDVTALGQAAVHLIPGERWHSGSFAGPQVQRIDTAQAMAWTQGRIVFDAMPLRQAVAEVNRYTDRKIAVTSVHHGQDPISGSFRPGDQAAFVKAVSALLPLRADPSADGGITLRDVSDPAP